MFIPIWILMGAGVVVLFVLFWTTSLARRRNPLPFPDPDSRIFSASSAEAKEAIVALLAQHGLAERFITTSGILRSIMWDGTIINVRPEEVARKLNGQPRASGWLPRTRKEVRGQRRPSLSPAATKAHVVLDAEPDLPIAFVVTDAFVGTVLNFRKHMIHLPRPR